MKNNFLYKLSETKPVHSDHIQINHFVIKLVSIHFYIMKKVFLLNIPDSLVDELINPVDNAC